MLVKAMLAMAVLLISVAPRAAASEATVSGNGIILKTVTITYPPSTRIFPGDGADAINANCVTCHSAAMVLV